MKLHFRDLLRRRVHPLTTWLSQTRHLVRDCRFTPTPEKERARNSFLEQLLLLITLQVGFLSLWGERMWGNGESRVRAHAVCCILIDWQLLSEEPAQSAEECLWRPTPLEFRLTLIIRLASGSVPADASYLCFISVFFFSSPALCILLFSPRPPPIQKEVVCGHSFAENRRPSVWMCTWANSRTRVFRRRRKKRGLKHLWYSLLYFRWRPTLLYFLFQFFTLFLECVAYVFVVYVKRPGRVKKPEVCGKGSSSLPELLKRLVSSRANTSRTFA